MADYLISKEADFDGVWAIIKLIEEDLPLLFRLRTDLRSVAGDPSMPLLFEIKWTYFLDAENIDQLPTPSQLDEMTAFEDAVVEALHGNRAALLVAVNTIEGERRWLWYCGDREKVERCMNTALNGNPSYPIRMEITEDPSWSFYMRWLEVVDAS